MLRTLHKLILTTVILCTTLWICSCNTETTVAGGGGGGISGTGKQVVASGEVSGAGSVVVNGISFSRSTASDVSAKPIHFSFDNMSSASESILRPGMIVTINGSYDKTANSGSYTKITYSPELRGRLDAGSVDTASQRFTALGRTVQTGLSTVYDGVADLTELASLQLNGVDVEVSGFLDSGDILVASRVAVTSRGTSGAMVQLKGHIGSVTGTSFAIGNLVVATAGATYRDMTAADLTAADLVVEVRGTLSGTTITHAQIERKTPGSGMAPGETVRIKGVAAAASGSFFALYSPDGPITIAITGSQFFRGSLPADQSIITAGTRLEVEGMFQPDGSLLAQKISTETEKNIRLEGNLTTIDSAANSFTLNGITVSVNSATSYRDKRQNPVAVLAFSGLAGGDHLQVDGYRDQSGAVTANQVQRTDASTVCILQGPVSTLSSSAATLAIMGVEVQLRPETIMTSATQSYSSFAAYSALITPGSTVIKAKGAYTGAAISADSIELQR